jgi:hypothetical protein
MLGPLPRSADRVPVGSASVGPGSPSIAHRSRKWDWADARSDVSTPRRLNWNTALEAGGWLVGDEVSLAVDVAADEVLESPPA